MMVPNFPKGFFETIFFLAALGAILGTIAVIGGAALLIYFLWTHLSWI